MGGGLEWAIKGVRLVAAYVLGEVLIARYSVPLVMAMLYVGLLGLGLARLQGAGRFEAGAPQSQPEQADPWARGVGQARARASYCSETFLVNSPTSKV